MTKNLKIITLKINWNDKKNKKDEEVKKRTN